MTHWQAISSYRDMITMGKKSHAFLRFSYVDTPSLFGSIKSSKTISALQLSADVHSFSRNSIPDFKLLLCIILNFVCVSLFSNSIVALAFASSSSMKSNCIFSGMNSIGITLQLFICLYFIGFLSYRFTFFNPINIICQHHSIYQTSCVHKKDLYCNKS